MKTVKDLRDWLNSNPQFDELPIDVFIDTGSRQAQFPLTDMVVVNRYLNGSDVGEPVRIVLAYDGGGE